MNEVFDSIPLFGSYLISNTGIVYSIMSDKFLKPKIDRDGYKIVCFYSDGKPIYKRIHRLVAEVFLANPEHKTQVNHIDFNRSNNVVSNLEWSTHGEDVMHKKMHNRYDLISGINHYGYGKNRGLSKSAKIVLNTENGIFYDCAKDASDACGIKYRTLTGRLRGRHKNNTPYIYA